MTAEPIGGAGRVPPVNAVAMGFDATPSGEVAVIPLGRTFVDFYRETRTQVARGLGLTLGDRELAEEATDEAMTRAYQHWSKVRGLDNPAGWVYRVGLNWSRSVLRRRRRPERHAPGAAFAELPELAEPTVVAALMTLSVEQRAVVVCRYLLGWSEADTATALGIRRGTAKSRTARALTQLRAQLQHLGPEGES